MSNKVYFFALLVFGNIFYACNSDDLAYSSEYEKSKAVWLEFKSSSNNTYSYTVVNSSWVGIGSKTALSIQDGIITQRDFEYTFADGVPDDFHETELRWTETGVEIGTHEVGAEALTLDEVYARAESDWLLERADATITFETANEGMISTCGYVPDGCADDCFRGIQISSIEAL